MTIAGDPGVGKTRLVRELWERLAENDRSRCASDRSLPRVRTGHHVLAAGRGAQGASRDSRERFARRAPASARGSTDSRADARARRCRRPASARRAGPTARSLDHVSLRARRTKAGRAVDRGSSPGRGTAARPDRADRARRLGSSAHPDHDTSRLRLGPHRLGRATRQRDDLARAPARRDVRTSRRLAARGRVAGRGTRPDRRTGRGKPVLRRRGAREPHRCRRPRARGRRLARARASGRLRDPRLGPGRARLPARPARHTGKDSVARGGRDRPNVLDRPGLRAGRRFGAGPASARAAGLHPPAAELHARGRGRVRLQACADAGRRLRRLTKARRARLHARFADWMERSDQARDEHAPLLAHHYAESVRPDDADLAWSEEDRDEVARLRAKAVQWLRHAAGIAISRYEIDDGIGLLRRPPTSSRTSPSRRVSGARSAGRTPPIRRRRIRGFDATLDRARRRPDRARRHIRRARFSDSLTLGMWPRRPGRELLELWASRAIAEAEPGAMLT